VWNNDASVTVGARGPILLEDYQLVEKLAQFDRERIPERVVHARGASAKGFFEVSVVGGGEGGSAFRRPRRCAR
jgi:catalase